MITGLKLIQAFDIAYKFLMMSQLIIRSKMTEKIYMSDSYIHNDKFIDQLVNITHYIIIESFYQCMSISKSSPHMSYIIIHREYQLSSFVSFILNI